MSGELVVIDNQIFPCSVKALSGRTVEVREIKKGKCVASRSSMYSHTHGTICTALAGEFFPEIEIIGISTSDEGNAIISNVCAALKWCLEKKVAIVCLSIGTVCNLGLDELADVTYRLAQQGTLIFCACSNDKKITFPAAYPWTIGVMFDYFTKEIVRTDSRLGYDVIVGYFRSNVLETLSKENVFFRSRTNSMAVAIAAKQIMQKGGIRNLPSGQNKLWYSNVKNAFSNWNKPVVRLHNSLSKNEELISLFLKEYYYAVIASDKVYTNWNKMSVQVHHIEEVAALLPCLTEISILFIDLNDLDFAVWDLEIDLNQMSMKDAYMKIVCYFGEGSS